MRCWAVYWRASIQAFSSPHPCPTVIPALAAHGRNDTVAVIPAQAPQSFPRKRESLQPFHVIPAQAGIPFKMQWIPALASLGRNDTVAVIPAQAGIPSPLPRHSCASRNPFQNAVDSICRFVQNERPTTIQILHLNIQVWSKAIDYKSCCKGEASSRVLAL